MEKQISIHEFMFLAERIRTIAFDRRPTIVINAGTCGQASGANDLIRIAKREIIARDLSRIIQLRITGCHGYCQMEPSVLIKPSNTFYPKVGMKEMVRIIDALVHGEVVEELLFHDPVRGELIERQDDLPFFKGQQRRLLERNELVDPIRIYDYIAVDGYTQFLNCLSNDDPNSIIEEVKASGLRGRGGAGFPTGIKWERLAQQPNNRGKYIICNADEGDPGAYMDRSLLEGNPHAIIEGMLIGALATGADTGVIYVRTEYPLAIKHLTIALRQALELGLLGDNILGSGFSFHIKMVRGAGAFVCGEETALMRSIEGRLGEPRQRPPFPAERGIQGCPTIINNVETWANIPLILRDGATAFAKIGTENNSGTKIFSLVGQIKNTGLVEVPMGISINDIIYKIGYGPVNGGQIKAVQTGGPSGGCIPSRHFDLKIDYDSLQQAGTIMGSGGMIVMDDSTCMVDVARYFMNFLRDESCGKCFTCRKGTQRMFELLDDISRGKGEMSHLDLLAELAQVVKDTSMCGLGQSAANPVLSTLRYFRDEYEDHILNKRCNAFVCRELVGAPCQSACPIGTEAWRYVAHISRGEFEDAYRVIRETNPFPSVCARVCDHKCESRCRLGKTGTRPVSIRALKRFITDRMDPSMYKPERASIPENQQTRVAVIGSGPAGMTAAHFLSLKGYKVTVFEAEEQPGGMLVAGVPSYRLPRSVIQKEIDALLDDNITLRCGYALGRDFSLDDLFRSDYKAVFLALGAHRSRRLYLENEDAEQVFPSIKFLRAFNLKGEQIARGKVGIIGGGNSAVDASRVAIRQQGVESVTIFYRRSRQEMPGYQEEIDAALEEGISLRTLVSPIKIHTYKGRLTSVDFIENALGERDDSGRAKFIPIEGSTYTIELDTLIVAIGEQLMPFSLEGSKGIEFHPWGPIKIDPRTLATNRPGVFAGGDIVTGPNTVIDAIAAGKKGASMIDRYLHGEPLQQHAEIRRPHHYVEPRTIPADQLATIRRTESPKIPLEKRRESYAEVELTFTEEQACTEAMRCLRCDLEFVEHAEHGPAQARVEIGE